VAGGDLVLGESRDAEYIYKPVELAGPRTARAAVRATLGVALMLMRKLCAVTISYQACVLPFADACCARLRRAGWDRRRSVSDSLFAACPVVNSVNLPLPNCLL
jgi:hypothetical protein